MNLTIEQWRKVKNITQRQLGTRLGVHENTIRSWERHPEKLSVEKAERISKALDVPLNNIIFCSVTLQNAEVN